jgi:hypothetical protein
MSSRVVTIENNEAVRNDRRRSRSKAATAQSERQRVPPKLFAFEVVTNQPKGAEVTDDPLAIAGGRGRGGTSFCAMEILQLVHFYAARPGKFAFATIIAARLQLAIGVGRQENAIAPD